MSDETEERKEIGTVQVLDRGQSLYFLLHGGEFSSGDIKGSFGFTGASVIVYCGTQAYEVLVADVVGAVLTHIQKEPTPT